MGPNIVRKNTEIYVGFCVRRRSCWLMSPDSTKVSLLIGAEWSYEKRAGQGVNMRGCSRVGDRVFT